MAEAASEPARSPFRLYTRLLPALGVATLIGSFIEADQRGLLFQSDDIALLAEDAALAVPNQGMGMYLGVSDARGGNRGRNIIGRPPGSRLVTGNASDLGDDNVVSPAPGGSRTILDQPARQEQASPTLTSGTTAPAAVSPPGNGSFGPSFPDSPIGLIAVGTNPPPTPVVPAVPEPASWLLMILGVGWLGLSLRRRERRDPWEAATPASAV